MPNLPGGENLISWLSNHELHVNWHLFSEPWDQMQRKHNPFRDEQIEVILSRAGIAETATETVLDLGCGPGILGRRILAMRPLIEYYGVDGDPLMLAAMRNLLPSSNIHPILVDLRSYGWLIQYQNRFDSIVSLTALHWLTKSQLEQLYTAMFAVLKPGGRLVIGDPYLPVSASERKDLLRLHEQVGLSESGMTWDEFWVAFYERYPIKAMRAAYQDSSFNGDLFQGSDDGYPIAFYLHSLGKAGFTNTLAYWKKGLRVVYGGRKPFPSD